MSNIFWDNITKEDIRELPLLTFNGPIYVVETESDFDRAIKALSTEKILGFDTEKKPTFKKGEYNPTAMIQLSSIDEAFLFRLNKIGYPKPLFDLMGNSDVTKLGISIDDDIKELEKLANFRPSGFIDVNDIAKGIGAKHIGVKKLAAIFLKHRISKGQQTSNWELSELTISQQRYAATDAWICLRIYNEIKKNGLLKSNQHLI
ncbi:MAG: 3'-5' exonuclease [Cyclobacteriaceae bacterium]